MPWIAGYPREKVNWSPTIDESKCVRCGMCMNCGKSVFEWADGKPLVVRPLECVVGCSTCGNLCQGRAITFPDIEPLLDLYKENNIWAHVKRALIDAGKIPATSPSGEPGAQVAQSKATSPYDDV